MRVTIEGERLEVSTQRYVEQSKWAATAGKVKGTSEEARNINQYLDCLQQKVYECQREILQEGKSFTKEALRLKWYGLEQRDQTLIGVFTSHNVQLKSLIGKGKVVEEFGVFSIEVS